ncbi:SDR family oxidoreductase [Haloparvum sp. PAK95]|uniref:SDR family oxidoreductase n=1 Tax=Haloparvum sp. PAK95 TaxID=3418962 RepID=UPI003D2EB627
MDHTVVITGGTRGLGRAVAREFVEAGAFVAICGRDGTVVEAAVDALREAAAKTDSGGDAWGMRADVRDEFEVERFLELAAREAGPIDAVVANAALSHGEPGEMPIDEESYASFDDTLRTNVRGVFATITEALPHLADDARVVVPSGSAATESLSGMGSYAVSKAGAEAVACGFAADVDATVGVVDPGLVATDLTGKENARDPESVAPLFRWAITEAPAEELNGGRLGLREWKKATR